MDRRIKAILIANNVKVDKIKIIGFKDNALEIIENNKSTYLTLDGRLNENSPVEIISQDEKIQKIIDDTHTLLTITTETIIKEIVEEVDDEIFNTPANEIDNGKDDFELDEVLNNTNDIIEHPEPVKVETTEPVKVETTEPVKVETTEPVKVEKTEPVKVEKTEPVKVEKTEPVKVEKTKVIKKPTKKPKPVKKIVKKPKITKKPKKGKGKGDDGLINLG
jgi:hypothetical protein